MKKLTGLQNAITVTMLVSVGIWFGIGLSIYSEEISTTVYIGLYILIPICACAQLWFYHRVKKYNQGENQQRTSGS